MKKLLLVLPACVLLAGCLPVDVLSGAFQIATSPAGQAGIRVVESTVQAVECDIAGSSDAGSFRYTSSNALCQALGGTPVRRVTVPVSTPISASR